MKVNTNLTQEQMIKEVDRFISEIGVNEDILGVNTTQDKLLYYWNYLDNNNIFRGVIELKNYYFIQLINLLCNSVERIKLFQDKFYNADGNIAQQIRQFRRYLLDSRDDTEDFLNIMNSLINSRNFDELHICLEELFLEPISDDIFDRIKVMIHTDNLNASDIYNWFIMGKNPKALVTFKTSYIKSLNKN